MFSTQAVIVIIAAIYGALFAFIWDAVWVGIVGFFLAWPYLSWQESVRQREKEK